MAQPTSRRKTRKKARPLTLEQELGQLFDSLLVASPSGRKAMQLRLGLTGTPPVSLTVAGNAAGLTRERVRQIESRFTKTLQKVQPATPVLDAALQAAAEILPAPDLDVERALLEKGFTKNRFSFRSLVNAAKLLGKLDVLPQEADEDAGRRPGSELPRRFVFSHARALISRWGASTFDTLTTELARGRTGNPPEPELVRLYLGSMPGFAWLDDEEEWFWVKGVPKNRLLGQIEKILSVAGSIEIGELRQGVARHPRMEGFRPPPEALARLCVQSGRYRRKGDRILEGARHPSWEEVLGPTLERKIVVALFDHGPVMRREELQRLVAGKWGVSDNAFQFHLRYSPVIARYAPGVYGLRGARVTPAKLKALLPPRARRQRLLDHAWTLDGQAWLGFRISSAALRSGNLALPASMRGPVKGSYSLFSERGWMIGTLLVTESQLQGLGTFFRHWGVEAGDYVVFNLDVARRLGMVTAGGEELLLRFQPGE